MRLLFPEAEVTRSLSNLIKSVYFNVDPSEVRMIDSDEKVEKYIPHIYDSKKETAVQDFSFQHFDDSAEEEENAEETYQDGLSVISMDDVVSQEREKLTEAMNEEKEKLLADAKREAEEIVAQAREESDVIREQARAEGERQGKEEGNVQAQVELARLREELQDEYDRRFLELDEQERNLEPYFAELVVSLVKKLTGVICEDKKDIILYLIGNAIKNLEKTGRISIRVSKEDMGRVSAKRATLKMIAKEVEEFEISEDSSLAQNQCMIETDNKIIDCSLDAQLQNLEEHMKLLIY